MLPDGGIFDDAVAAMAVAGTTLFVAVAVSDVCSFSPCPTYKLPNDKATLSNPPSPADEDVVVVVVAVVSLLLPEVLLLFSLVVVDSEPVVVPRAGEFVFGNLPCASS